MTFMAYVKMRIRLFQGAEANKVQRVAWENNWVISNQWDINAPLGFSDCLPASFLLHCNESGRCIMPGDLRLIKAKPLWVPTCICEQTDSST